LLEKAQPGPQLGRERLVRVVAVVQVELDLPQPAKDGVAEHTQAAGVGVVGRVEPGVLRHAAVGVAVPPGQRLVVVAPRLGPGHGLLRVRARNSSKWSATTTTTSTGVPGGMDRGSNGRWQRR